VPRRTAAASGGRQLGGPLPAPTPTAVRWCVAATAARRPRHHVPDKKKPRTEGRVPPPSRGPATAAATGQGVLRQAAKTFAAHVAALALVVVGQPAATISGMQLCSGGNVISRSAATSRVQA